MTVAANSQTISTLCTTLATAVQNAGLDMMYKATESNQHTNDIPLEANAISEAAREQFSPKFYNPIYPATHTRSSAYREDASLLTGWANMPLVGLLQWFRPVVRNRHYARGHALADAKAYHDRLALIGNLSAQELIQGGNRNFTNDDILGLSRDLLHATDPASCFLPSELKLAFEHGAGHPHLASSYVIHALNGVTLALEGKVSERLISEFAERTLASAFASALILARAIDHKNAKQQAMQLFAAISHQLIKRGNNDASAMAMELAAKMHASSAEGISHEPNPYALAATGWFDAMEAHHNNSNHVRTQQGLMAAYAAADWKLAEEFFYQLAGSELTTPQSTSGKEHAAERYLQIALMRAFHIQQQGTMTFEDTIALETSLDFFLQHGDYGWVKASIKRAKNAEPGDMHWKIKPELAHLKKRYEKLEKAVEAAKRAKTQISDIMKRP